MHALMNVRRVILSTVGDTVMLRPPAPDTPAYIGKVTGIDIEKSDVKVSDRRIRSHAVQCQELGNLKWHHYLLQTGGHT